MIKHGFRVLFCLLLLWSTALFADTRIVITEGVDSARPIAIVPFKWSGIGTPPQRPEDIIASDLRNSGKFSPVSIANMPQQPEHISDINPESWRALGVDAIVIGSMQPATDGKILVNYQLVDVVNAPGEVVAQNQYVITQRWLRYAIHTASDEIFEKLTGIKGAFRTRIAYVVSNRGNGPYSHELRVADYDGHDQITVHRSTAPLMSPTWSPDGNQLVFVSFEGGRSSLLLKNLSSGAITKLTSFPGHNGAPAFSPDGSKLAMSLSKDGNLNIYVMNLTTKSIRQITQSRSNNTEPSWFPDNQTLAYTSDQAGRPQLYMVNINSGESKRLTWEGRQNQNATVSTDGSFIVLVSTDDSKRQNIVKLDVANGALQTLTTSSLNETPSISPNGIMVIYSSFQGASSVLNLVSTDGRFKARLPVDSGDVRFPTWSPYL